MKNKYFEKMGNIIYGKNVNNILKMLKKINYDIYIEDEIKLNIVKSFPKNMITMTTIFDDVKLTWEKEYITNSLDRISYVHPICRQGCYEEKTFKEIGNKRNFKIGYNNETKRVHYDREDDIIIEKEETIIINDEISFFKERYEDVDYDNKNNFPCETEDDYDIQEYFYNRDVFEDNLVIYVPKKLIKF